MRGVEARIQEIRHRMLREVARTAYHTEWPMDERIESLSYRIIPGEVGNLHNDVSLERVIAGGRLRLAMGLPCQNVARHAPLSENIEAADRPETYYTPSLINAIKLTCNGCAEERVLVTEDCQGYLAHPHEGVYPEDTIKLDRYNGRSHIDPCKYTSCGRCADMYFCKAIIIQERPCTVARRMDAIGTDANDKTEIDSGECASCGMCLVSCPFGAIADESQIFQVIQVIQSGGRVYAVAAPTFASQSGPGATPGKLRVAVRQPGPADAFEMVIDADLYVTQEAEDLIRGASEELPFMGTSCCPAWSVMAKKLHPDHIHCIFMAPILMTLIAHLIKHERPNAKAVFIGSCVARKLEAVRKSVRNEMDLVLTFEEIAGIFAAKYVDLTTIEEDPGGASGAPIGGYSLTVSGGVAKTVVNVIQRRCPDREIEVASSQGLRECHKMMQEAVAGKYPGYLLEGMACPGGYVAGVGTMQSIKKSQAAVDLYVRQAEHKTSDETEYIKEPGKLMG